MSVAPQLWLLAGGNGAGKSTFYHTQLAPLGLPFINADEVARQLYPEAPEEHSYAAARVAADMREQALRAGRSFCFETVFSHPSKIDFVAQAKAYGYYIVLVFIHLSDISLNQARVQQRVAAGGHHVPEDKVRARLPRVLAHIQQTLPLCNQVRMLDNSRIDDPFRPVLTLREGQLTAECSPLPAWALTLVEATAI